MGMFDSVDYWAACPLCGTRIGPLDWQSKSGPLGLSTLTPTALMDHVIGERQADSMPEYTKDHPQITFYSDCPKCEAWVEIAVTRYAKHIDRTEESEES